MTSTASTSNLPLFLVPFGLPPCLTPLQHPIRLSFSFLLDFLRVSLRFNVQSASLSRPFWTSSVSHSTSKSNPPISLVPFGLQPWLPPLQSPIRHISCFPSSYIYVTLPEKVLLPTTKNSRRNKPCGSNHTLY